MLGFYSVLFPELTQKARSGILKFLWQNDPFKAKWAILAKAYSIIRDDHEGEVTLDQFLTLNIDFIRILEPTRYLEAMGWELNIDDQQQYTMARVNVVTTADAEIATNYSVDDVVKHCYDSGLVVEAHRTHNERSNGNGAVMAFAAQPNLVVNQNDNVQIEGTNNIVHANFDANSAVVVPAIGSEHTLSLPYPGDMNAMVINAQIAGGDHVLPIQNDPMLHAIHDIHDMDFGTDQSLETDNDRIDVSETYSETIEAQYADGTLGAIRFEDYVQYMT